MYATAKLCHRLFFGVSKVTARADDADEPINKSYQMEISYNFSVLHFFRLISTIFDFI